MKNVLEILGKVGFLKASEYISKEPEKQISSEAIILRFKEKKEVPSEILSAIQNIKDPQIQKRAAVHLLRIAIYAKTIEGHGRGILWWFENGRVTDLGTEMKISVSTLNKAAANFNKTIAQLSDTQERVSKIQSSKSAPSKRQLASLDIAAAKSEFLQSQSEEQLGGFLQALDNIYLSLAGERK